MPHENITEKIVIQFVHQEHSFSVLQTKSIRELSHSLRNKVHI